ncbi:hypothetical protein EJ08DRAFT_664416 [Tothia fuscella]|uniref:Uncharacterized protein n=1 Tax=Tothia fuscella TaxID=1048955 RepID=A0A9P4NJH5_9PEZI|nr:hypothetical protein EJ08DRAFT_664416 [Tothia fuscella]
MTQVPLDSEVEEKDHSSRSGALVKAEPKNVTSSLTHDIHFSFGPHTSLFMHLRNRWWLCVNWNSSFCRALLTLPDGSGDNTKTWQKNKDNHLIGTGNTYYTRTPKGCLWNNIPIDLENTITEHMPDRGAPSNVCLGVNDTWVVFWDNGRIQWILKSYHNTVYEKLSRDTTITRPVLDPYSSDFFLHQKNGMIIWSVQFDEASGARQEFIQRCQAYMQERAREDGSTFEMENWTCGSKTSKQGYMISPTTKWDMVAEDIMAGTAMRFLPMPDSWSQRLRQHTASNEWCPVIWSGAALGVFGTAIAVWRRRARLFRR